MEHNKRIIKLAKEKGVDIKEITNCICLHLGNGTCMIGSKKEILERLKTYEAKCIANEL